MNLRDAIDQDKFIIDDRTFTDAEIQAMDIDALETLKMQITKKITGLSAALKEKQIDYASYGKGTSKEWYMKRRHALSINQRVLTYVNFLTRKRLRRERSIGDCFMNQAKVLLRQNDFDAILKNARDEMALLQGR
jgi:hypothetical protein